MADPTPPTTEIRTAHWYGRMNAFTPAYCTLNGWREGIWRRDDKGKWYEAEATIRPVVGITIGGMDDGRRILGEPRKVL